MSSQNTFEVSKFVQPENLASKSPEQLQKTEIILQKALTIWENRLQQATVIADNLEISKITEKIIHLKNQLSKVQEFLPSINNIEVTEELREQRDPAKNVKVILGFNLIRLFNIQAFEVFDLYMRSMQYFSSSMGPGTKNAKNSQDYGQKLFDSLIVSGLANLNPVTENLTLNEGIILTGNLLAPYYRTLPHLLIPENRGKKPSLSKFEKDSKQAKSL